LIRIAYEKVPKDDRHLELSSLQLILVLSKYFYTIQKGGNGLELFDASISNLEHGLKYASLKNKTIAQNIANVDTPNYKAKDVSFKKLLSEENQKQIRAYKTDFRHFDFVIKPSTHVVYSYENYQYRHNGNGVDMDQEMADLAKNTIYYNALIDRINGKFSSLNTVIKGGK